MNEIYDVLDVLREYGIEPDEDAGADVQTVADMPPDMLDGLYPPSTPSGRWVVAPQMIRALMNIDADIYVILPSGAKPLFKPTSIDPGVTISTDQAKKALIRKYGYAEVSGGKGSHVKLTKAGAKPIVLRGHQAALSPGLLKHVLAQLGDYPLSRAREIL